MPDENPTSHHHPLYLFATGLCMGSADVVPGVSGGTMAFIMGIYQQLLDAIRAVNVDLLRRLMRGEWRCLLTRIPWRFLIPLGLGIVAAISSLAGPLEHLLRTQEALLFAFFFGLVVASVATLGWRHAWRGESLIGCVAGAWFAYWLVGAVPISPGHSPWILFGSGAIAICAMILPGISGSFILLILGQYQYCMESISGTVAAIKTLDWSSLFGTVFGTILPFGLGAIVGLALFARILGWLLTRHHGLTIGVLIGFMMGSLRRLWPFKEYLKFGVDRHGEPIPLEWQNILPINGTHPWVLALTLFVAGFVLIVLIDLIGNRKRHA